MQEECILMIDADPDRFKFFKEILEILGKDCKVIVKASLLPDILKRAFAGCGEVVWTKDVPEVSDFPVEIEIKGENPAVIAKNLEEVLIKTLWKGQIVMSLPDGLQTTFEIEDFPDIIWWGMSFDPLSELSLEEKSKRETDIFW